MNAQSQLRLRDVFEPRQSSHAEELHHKPQSTLPSSIYLALAVCGAVATWTYNILWMHHVQRAITLQEFVVLGFQGSALLGSLASDFWLGSLASFIFMIVEGRRLGMRQLWACVVLTLVVAWACGLPFFFYLRERALSARNLPLRAAHAAASVRRG